MKKCVVLVVCLLLIVSHVCFAEVDLESMSNDELVALRDSVHEELIKRGVEYTADFYQATYIVGKDIAPGVYDILFEGLDHGVAITTYETEDDYQNRNNRDFNVIDGVDSGYHIRLEEGMVIDLEINGNGSIKISNTKMPWNP